MSPPIPSPTPRPGRTGRSVLLGLLLVAISAAWLTVTWEPPQRGRLLFGGWTFPRFATGGFLTLIGSAVLLAGISPRAAARAALLAAGSLAAYVIAEVGWLALTPFASANSPVLGTRPIPSVSQTVQTLPDIAATWNLPADPVTVSYVTNLHGYRNDPDTTSADLYCIGDSYLVAALVPWPTTVVARLSSILEIPTMNVALIDQSPQTAQARFRSLDPMPDIAGKVILQFICEDNDLLDSAADGVCHDEASRDTSLWKRSLMHRIVLWAQSVTQPSPVEAARRTGELAGHPVRFLWVHERGSQVEDQLPVIAGALSDFAAWLDSRGAAFGVVLIPSKTRVLGPLCQFPPTSELVDLEACLSPMPDYLAEWSKKSGIPFLDLTSDLFEAASAGDIAWFSDDTHWNVEGHRVAAAAVAAWPWLRTAINR